MNVRKSARKQHLATARPLWVVRHRSAAGDVNVALSPEDPFRVSSDRAIGGFYRFGEISLVLHPVLILG